MIQRAYGATGSRPYSARSTAHSRGLEPNSARKLRLSLIYIPFRKSLLTLGLGQKSYYTSNKRGGSIMLEESLMSALPTVCCWYESFLSIEWKHVCSMYSIEWRIWRVWRDQFQPYLPYRIHNGVSWPCRTPRRSKLL